MPAAWSCATTEVRCGWRLSPSSVAGASSCAPRRRTPIFFLDDPVAGWLPGIALVRCAGGRPIAPTATRDRRRRIHATASGPRTRSTVDRRAPSPRSRSLARAADRRLWTTDVDDLPAGTVIVDDDRRPNLLLGDSMWRFTFDGWSEPVERPRHTQALVLRRRHQWPRVTAMSQCSTRAPPARLTDELGVVRWQLDGSDGVGGETDDSAAGDRQLRADELGVLLSPSSRRPRG